MNIIKTTFASLGERVLVLGRAGEHLATRVEIDCAPLLTPGATALVKACTAQGALYPATVSVTDGVVAWPVRNTDTAQAGHGSIQVSIIAPDGALLKTAVAPTLVLPSLDEETGDAPNPITEWLQNAQALTAAMAPLQAQELLQLTPRTQQANGVTLVTGANNALAAEGVPTAVLASFNFSTALTLAPNTDYTLTYGGAALAGVRLYVHGVRADGSCRYNLASAAPTAVFNSGEYPTFVVGIEFNQNFNGASVRLTPSLLGPSPLDLRLERIEAAISAREGEGMVYSCTLKADGSGSFSSLRQCAQALSGLSGYSRYDVYVYPGTYDVRADYTDDEWQAEGFVGLRLPDGINLIGTGGAREDIVITCASETPSSVISALNLSRGYCGLHHLTVQGSNVRYTVHDDHNGTADASLRDITDVDFIGENLVAGAVYGAGTWGNSDWVFENCRFHNKTYPHCFLYHDCMYPRTRAERCTFRNCEFSGKGPWNLLLRPAKGGVDVTVVLEGCTLNGIEISSRFSGDAESTTVMRVLGHGNSKGIVESYYNDHDRLSFPRFGDCTGCWYNAGSAAIARGDAVRLENGQITRSDAATGCTALENIPAGSFGYVRIDG